MENIEKCLAIAISELGKISFSGPLLIPAGKVMNALCLAMQEVQRLKAEAKEEKPEEEQNGDS